MGTRFQRGKNKAIRVPNNEFQKTVAFYRDISGLRTIEAAWSPDKFESIAFDFDGKNMLIDCKT